MAAQLNDALATHHPPPSHHATRHCRSRSRCWTTLSCCSEKPKRQTPAQGLQLSTSGALRALFHRALRDDVLLAAPPRTTAPTLFTRRGRTALLLTLLSGTRLSWPGQSSLQVRRRAGNCLGCSCAKPFRLRRLASDGWSPRSAAY